MEKNILAIDIQKPVAAVFQFTVNPKNTSKWIPSILEEKTSEQTQIGTVYSQKVMVGKKCKKSALVVTGFIENKQLDFHSVNGKYSCSYYYEKIPSGTRLTYSEENGVGGKISEPMTMDCLKILKKLIEES